MNTSSSTTVGYSSTKKHLFEETWVKFLKILFVSVVVLLTACGNGLVLWALKRFVALRKPSHIYLGGLAFADLTMVLPLQLKIVQILTNDPNVCVSQGITELITVSCISLHLACISVERFVSIKYCLRYDSIVTKRRIYTSIAIIWIISACAAFIIPVIIHPRHFQDLADGLLTLCTPKKFQPMSDLPDQVFHYALFMMMFFFAFPCVVILMSNLYIFAASSRQRRKIISQQIAGDQSKWTAVTKRLLGDLKAARNLFFIQALFVAAYFPYFAVTVHRIEHSDDDERLFFHISKGLSFLTELTSCINPFIYVLGNEQFKKAFKKLLCFPEKKRQESSSSQRDERQT